MNERKGEISAERESEKSHAKRSDEIERVFKKEYNGSCASCKGEERVLEDKKANNIMLEA